MFAQRLVNLIFRMAGGNVGDRLGPSQRRAFGRSKVGAYPPARKGIQFALRHAAFAQRRKTLRQALSGIAGSSAAAQVALEAAGLSSSARGETLTVEDFARVAEQIFATGDRS